MTSDLVTAVLDEAWPCPEVSAHSGYTYTPGRHWPLSPTKRQRQLPLRPLLTSGGQCHSETRGSVLVCVSLPLPPRLGPRSRHSGVVCFRARSLYWGRLCTESAGMRRPQDAENYVRETV